MESAKEQINFSSEVFINITKINDTTNENGDPRLFGIVQR